MRWPAKPWFVVTGAIPHVSERPLISYAPNGEDIVLWRALGYLTPGWYVDVGANHPVVTSITKLFSERGWRGINVEPLPDLFAALELDRPDDVNLRVALADLPGELPLFVVADDPQRTTLSADLAQLYRDEGYRVVETPTPVRTLTDVLDEHPLPRIDFLKIDAEGVEDQIVRGLDLARYRPSVIVAEEGAHQKYEFPHLLAEAGYDELLWDGLNRYFAAAEAPERIRLALRYAANPSLDGYVRHDLFVAQQHIDDLEHARLAAASAGGSAAARPELPSGPQHVQRLVEHIDEIHASMTWRVGSAVLAPLRWLRGARDRLRARLR